MGQSGDLSAVGFAIESYFRQPPLTLISGSAYSLGASGTNPLRYQILDPCQGFDAVVQYDAGKEVDGSNQQRRITLVGKTYLGELNWKADPENTYYALLGIFGRDIQSTLAAATTTTITGATNATPIVITDVAHGYATGQQILVSGVTGNTAANGEFFITVLSANTYSLNGSAGNGVYGAGGTATLLTTGAYSHKFLPGKKKPSFSAEVDIADGTYGEMASGVVFDKIEFDFGKELMIKASVIGHRFLPNTYPNGAGVPTKTLFGVAPALIPPALGGNGTKTIQATADPAYVDVPMDANGDGPLTFAGMTFGTQAGFSAAFIQINGVAYPLVLLEGSKIVVQQEVDSRMIAGSGYDPGTVTANKFLVTGTLVAEWDDMTLPSAMLDFDQVAINFLLVGSPIGATGFNYSMEFHLPHVKLSKAPVGLVDGTIVISSDFTAKEDDSLLYSLMVISQNTFNNATLAGQYEPPCVVTTAIPNNTTDIAVVNTTAGLVQGATYNLAGATNAYNPCTLTTITDGTHIVLTGAAAQTTIQTVSGGILVGASLTPTSGQYAAGGVGGWLPN